MPMRYALSLVVLFAFGSPLAAQSKPEYLQWNYCALVPAASDVNLDIKTDTAGQNSWVGEAFPYTVPSGKALGIVSVMVSSKMRVGRAGYFVVDNVVSLPTDVGSFNYPIPYVVPEGKTLHGHVINNSLEDQQWMCAYLQGVLVDAPAGANYRTLFADLKLSLSR